MKYNDMESEFVS